MSTSILYVGAIQNVSYIGNFVVKNASDLAKTCTISVDSNGDATIDASGNDLNLSSTDMVHVLNATNSSSRTTGALVVSGGLGVNNTITAYDGVFNGGVDIWGTGGRTSGIENAYLKVRSSILLWDDTSHSIDSWIKLKLEPTGGDARKLVITGGGWNGSLTEIQMPLVALNATDSSSIITGAFQVTGGAAIAMKLHVGSDLVLHNVGDTSKITTFNVSADGDLSIDASGNDINMASTDKVHVLNTTASINQYSGGLTVSGGIGAVGSANLGSEMVLHNGTAPNLSIKQNATSGGYLSIGAVDAVTGAIFVAPLRRDPMVLQYTAPDPTTFNPTGTFGVGGGTFTNGRLDLSNNATWDTNKKYLSWASPPDFVNTGCVRMKITPNYSGFPAKWQQIFEFGKGITNDGRSLIMLYHRHSDGYFCIYVHSEADNALVANGATIGTPWSPIAGTEYDFVFNFDAVAGTLSIYIDNVAIGTLAVTTGDTRVASSYFTVGGAKYNSNSWSNAYFRDVMIFNTIQSNSPVPLTVGGLDMLPGDYVKSDSVTLRSPMDPQSTYAVASVNRNGALNFYLPTIPDNVMVTPTRLPGAIFTAPLRTSGAALMTDSYDALYTDTAYMMNGATFSGGKLNVNHHTLQECAQWPAGVPDFGDVGCIRVKFTPMYTDLASRGSNWISIFSMVDITAGSKNRLTLLHTNTNILQILIYSSSSVSLYADNFGSWTPVSGQEYDIMCNFNLTTSKMSLYIDGVIKNGEKTITAGTRLVDGVPSTNMMLRVGADAVSGAYGYMYIRDFVIYNTTQLPYVGVFPPLVGGIEASIVNIPSQYGGLMLPTIGGTPSLLNFYEVYDWTTSVTGPYTLNGVVFRFTRIGNIVSLSIPEIYSASGASALLTCSEDIPARFAPYGAHVGFIRGGWSNNVFIKVKVSLHTSVHLTFYVESTTLPITYGNFAATGAAGVERSNITYTAA